jgi:hypothetical protein
MSFQVFFFDVKKSFWKKKLIDLRTLLHQIAKVELDAIYAYFVK